MCSNIFSYSIFDIFNPPPKKIPISQTLYSNYFISALAAVGLYQTLKTVSRIVLPSSEPLKDDATDAKLNQAVKEIAKLQLTFKDQSKELAKAKEANSKLQDQLTLLGKNGPTTKNPSLGNIEDLTPGNDAVSFVKKVFKDDLVEFSRLSNAQDISSRKKETTDLLTSLALINTPNALIVGPPGVGKTTLVENLACLIAQDKVPPFLKDAKIISLSATSIEAGCSLVGMKQARIKLLLEEIKKRTEKGEKIILFIDEFHATMQDGAKTTNQLGDMLKTAMARGEIKVIGATTDNELHIIAKDEALMRRFNLVEITEPNQQDLENMVLFKLQYYAKAHKIQLENPNEIVKLAISHSNDLKQRGIITGFQPHIAVNLLDKMMARAIINNELKNNTFDENVFSKQLEETYKQHSV